MDIRQALLNVCGEPEEVRLECIKLVARALNSPTGKKFASNKIKGKCHPLTIHGLLPHLSGDAKRTLKSVLDSR